MIQSRTSKDQLCFMPIHDDELKRNSVLTQNPGY